MTNNVQDRADFGSRAARRTWTVAGCVLVLIGFYLAALYYTDVAAAVEVWTVSPTYNHAFLILPICLYLVWDRRQIFRRLAPQPDLRLALGLPVVGGIWLLADLASVMEGKQLALVAMLQVAIMTIVGLKVYRAFLFPSLYMFFLVPTGEYLVPPLQTFTAEFSVAALRLLNIPVYLDGIFISIPTGHFKVAEACAGLRFLIATVAFGFLFANLMYASFSRRFIFVALCIVIPVIANGFRALGIILVAYLSNNKLATGVDHIVYGWVFFSFVMVLLIWIGMQFRDSKDEGEAVAPAFAWPEQVAGRQAVLGSAVVVMLLSALAPAAATHLRLIEPSADPAKLSVPDVQQPWNRVEATSEWAPSYPTADRILAQTYQGPSGAVDLAIVFYRRQVNDREVVASGNKVADGSTWDIVEEKVVTLNVGGEMVPFVLTRIVAGTQQRLVLRTYWIGSNLTIGRLKSKLLQLYGELVSGDRAAAAILLSTEVEEDLNASLTRLQDFLQRVEPIDTLLKETG